MIGGIIVIVVVLGFLMWKFPKARMVLGSIAVALGAGVAAFWDSISPLLGLG